MADIDMPLAWRMQQDGYLMQINQLRDENAELRKLVRDMDECLEHSKPFCKKCKFQELDCQWFKFDDRMRELGIEVDA